MSEIKDEILEIFEEEVEFLDGKDEQLIGYAEMFGRECILLYKDINFTAYSPEESIDKIQILNPKSRTVDGYDSCLLGHLNLDKKNIILLYDKEAIIEQLKQEYLSDKTGLFDGEEDCETSAFEWYEYNILGSYMDGMPAFAVLYCK